MIKTAALLLKSIKYREKDKLLTFYTQDLGKITALCKNARSTGHRWGSSTEPPAFAYLQLYEKNGYYTLTEICTLESFLHMEACFDRLIAYQFLSSLLDRYCPLAMPQPLVFQKVQSLFFYWKQSSASVLYSLYHFLMQFLALQGYEFSWKNCVFCHKSVAENPSEIFYCDLVQGILCCSHCAAFKGKHIPLSASVCLALSRLNDFVLMDSKPLDFPESQWIEVDRIIGYCYKEKIDPYFISYYQVVHSLVINGVKSGERSIP